MVIGQPFLADPLALQGRLCRRIERHIKELFGFVAEPDVPWTTTPPSAACAMWLSAADQRGHPVGTWHREQDDAGIHLRHLARTRPEPPRRLPPTLTSPH